MTLYGLTRHESGIVCYGDSVIVLNWANYEDWMLPVMAPAGLGVIPFPVGDDEHPWTVAGPEFLEDVREALPGVVRQGDSPDEIIADGMDIVYDEWGDIPMLFGFDIGAGSEPETDENGNQIPSSGEVYTITTQSGEEVKIISPSFWN